MSYLAIARGVVTGYERNELNERSLKRTPHDAERLKARIIEAVTTDPAHFDRTAYERLLAIWNALDAKETTS